MLSTLERPRVVGQRTIVDSTDLEDVSPFGLQGLKRSALRLLKSESIPKLAAALAIKGTRAEIRDEGFVWGELSRHPEWRDEYEVVHLIEKSLWINGRSDLVMTLTKNPSQIPDSPPPQILKSLSQAYALHPESTIWYGVPLFGEEKTVDGLPIPLSAQQVRDEHQKRIEAAQRLALRYRAFYRTAETAAIVPRALWRAANGFCGAVTVFGQRLSAYRKQMRRDSRARAQARLVRELEYTRCGRCWTQMPEHSTFAGRISEQTMEAVTTTSSRLAFNVNLSGVSAGSFAAGLTVAQVIPMFFVPLMVVPCDPFLFMELPDEPGKLRHLGHWYWQINDRGEKKLHLHT